MLVSERAAQPYRLDSDFPKKAAAAGYPTQSSRGSTGSTIRSLFLFLYLSSLPFHLPAFLRKLILFSLTTPLSLCSVLSSGPFPHLPTLFRKLSFSLLHAQLHHPAQRRQDLSNQYSTMNRIFGTSSSSKKPKPTLQDVIDQVGVASLERHTPRWYSPAHILDGFPLGHCRSQDKKA